MKPLEDITETGKSDAALFDHYGPAIFAYLRLHAITREDAEDLMVEVFTAALEHDQLSAIPQEEQLAWLRRVAHNKLVDSYRRASRRSIVALEQAATALVENENQSPENLALQRELFAQLHQFVGTLPPLQQQVLRLRYGNSLPFAEIAVLLNRREEAVRKILSRTLVQLRGLLQNAQERGR